MRFRSAPATIDGSGRFESLDQSGFLITGLDGRFDDLLTLSSLGVGCSMTVIVVADADQPFHTADPALASTLEGMDGACFIKAVLDAGDMFHVPDMLLDARFASHPLVVGAQSVRFCAAVPLLSVEGGALGALLVMDATPRAGLQPEQEEALRALGRLSLIHI